MSDQAPLSEIRLTAGRREYAEILRNAASGPKSIEGVKETKPWTRK
jgi:hypothetical protein